MKKSLLLPVAIVAATGILNAASWKTETVWQYGVVNGVANPVPGLDGGWSGFNNTNADTKEATATCSRFGTGYKGNIITTDDKLNAIISINESGVTKLWDLPARTLERWNGTVVTTDQAGNVIINYSFTNAALSDVHFAVITPDGTITNVDLAESLTDLNLDASKTQRIDNLGQLVGNAISPEGAIGYATYQNTGQIVMLTFKGDGTKVTSLNGTKCPTYLTALANQNTCTNSAQSIPSALNQAVPALSTVAEINAADVPSQMFYVTIGCKGGTDAAKNVPSVSEGWVGKFDPNWNPALPPMGNRGHNGIATFVLDGKRYIVRNYIDPQGPLGTILLEDGAQKYNNWKNVMTFGIFDVTDGTCVASWQESEYLNAQGMGSLSVEPIDETSVYVYTYASTGTVDGDTKAGCYCAKVKVTLDNTPDLGTAENPVLIATADDLCNAYKAIVPGQVTYYKQTADIDMAGVKDYTAINGFNGVYSSAIVYDGGNHVIRNFGPEDKDVPYDSNNYYCTSVFGVLSGSVSNLGIIDCNITTAQGAGALAGYAGHAAAPDGFKASTLDNVFVTGSINATGSYTGAFFGTQSGPSATYSNCYTHATVTGAKNTAQIVGRTRVATTLNNVYVSGAVNCSGANKADVLASDQTPAITFNNVVNTLGGAACNVTTTGEATTDINVVKTWDAFNAGNTLNNLPALNWQTSGAGIGNISTDDKNAPVEYFNLQGVRVDNPSNGLYIRRQGTKATKVIL